MESGCFPSVTGAVRARFRSLVKMRLFSAECDLLTFMGIYRGYGAGVISLHIDDSLTSHPMEDLLEVAVPRAAESNDFGQDRTSIYRHNKKQAHQGRLSES